MAADALTADAANKPAPIAALAKNLIGGFILSSFGFYSPMARTFISGLRSSKSRWGTLLFHPRIPTQRTQISIFGERVRSSAGLNSIANRGPEGAQKGHQEPKCCPETVPRRKEPAVPDSLMKQPLARP